MDERVLLLISSTLSSMPPPALPAAETFRLRNSPFAVLSTAKRSLTLVARLLSRNSMYDQRVFRYSPRLPAGITRWMVLPSPKPDEFSGYMLTRERDTGAGGELLPKTNASRSTSAL
jgi:hypothetical protein